MKGVFLLSSIFSIFALLAICVFLFARGFPTIFKDIGFFDFIFGRTWHPQIEIFGIWPMILGSLYVTALTTVMGVTLGIFTAVFIFKFCPKKLVGIIRQIINLLAGIPSIIFGLFGIMVVVPFLASISHTSMGEGILAASIILSIMILPTVVSISLNSLYAVPDTIYEGALALGATKQQAVFKAVLPAAKSGILTAVVLSIGRAIGETMAVIMVVGQSSRIPTDILQPINTMTATIASGALEVDGLHFEALIAIGVVLFIFTLLLNAGFSFFKNRAPKSKKIKKEKENEIVQQT
ncbi:MAG: phosphate ABC transporter permease subunit PstC, partial [Firmicutes bacterium]|nr:phosphate ABC transporter permease subunit PstC [Bacillota bacterium]